MSNLVQLEEIKRNRHLDPREKWRLIQEAITWAEAQSTVRRNMPQRCLAEQAGKLSALQLAGNWGQTRRRLLKITIH